VGAVPTPGGRLPEIATPSQPATIVDGTDPRADGRRLHEQGYVCLGLAHFDDLDERMSLDDEKKDAFEFARSVGAETVIVYRRAARAWTEERTRMVSTGEISVDYDTEDEYVRVDDGNGESHVARETVNKPVYSQVQKEEKYEVTHPKSHYIATFWAKPQPGAFGALTRDLTYKERNDGMRGVVVSVVLRGSPAAAAGLQYRDVILSVAGQQVTDSPGVRAQIARLNGQRVPIDGLRRQRPFHTEVALGPAAP
jgi:hypothetical protein